MYLATVAALCGCALSFIIPVQHPVASPRVQTMLEADMYSVVTRLSAVRDEAIMNGDPTQLYALTVEGSPARSHDERLGEYMGRVEEIETRIDDVDVLDERTVRVYSQQYRLRIDGRDMGQAPQRCTIWHMNDAPWRIEKTEDCT